MKIIMLGIAIILFGISVILITLDSPTGYGFGISFIGLVVSFIGTFQSDIK